MPVEESAIELGVGRLVVRARLIAAHQAVDIGLVRKVERIVAPSVTRVTRFAQRPVGLDSDTKVVYQIAFADLRRFRAYEKRIRTVGYEKAFSRVFELR